MERENETRGAKKKKNNLKGRRKKEHMGWKRGEKEAKYYKKIKKKKTKWCVLVPKFGFELFNHIPLK
jgi:hypothetical protein